jgi:hypothetical protein
LKHFHSVLAYDEKWNDIENTEQYAFSQAVKLLPEVHGALYFGFPWTTLIDQLHSYRSESSRLIKVLSKAKSLLKNKKYVITVCQHIDLLKYRSFLEETGVTHVFWPHMCEGKNCFPEYNDIKILPFPLAPTKLLDGISAETKEIQYLYSYCEPEIKGSRLSQTHDLILNYIKVDKSDLVNFRDQSKFKKSIVYHKNIKSGFRDKCFRDSAQIDYMGIIQKSIFTLCLSSPGPNSEHLWQSIGCGSIPVIFGDAQFLPGSKALWDEAAVLRSGRKEDILALSDHLENIARDEPLLERKRKALRQLWMQYGPDYFIYDISKLFLDLAQENYEIKKDRSLLSYCHLFAMASVINRRQNFEKDEFDLFMLGCSSRVISDPFGFKSRFEDNKEFRMAYKKALNFCNRQYYDSMRRNLKFKGINLN